MRPVTVAQ